MDEIIKERMKWTYKGKERVVVLHFAEDVKVEVIDEEPVELQTALPPKRTIKRNKNEKDSGCATCGSKGIKRLLTGGAKLLKAELGMDACDEETIIDRRNMCESCEHYDFGVCDQCGCFCAAKVKLKSEKCPKGLW